MSNKVVRFFEVPVYRKKISESSKRIFVCGIQIYKKMYERNKIKVSILGLPVYKKKYNDNIVKSYVFGINYKTSKLNDKVEIKRRHSLGVDPKKLNVIFKLSGGLGDHIISINYILKVIKKYKKEDIEFYVSGSVPALNFLVNGKKEISGIFTPEIVLDNRSDFDLLINLVRFPHIPFIKKTKVAEYSIPLLDYFYQVEKFCVQYPRFFECGRTCDGQSNQFSKLHKKNRVTSPDILNLFNIKEIDYEIFHPSNENLIELGILKNKFITIHRGNDTKNSSTCVKLWPHSYYEILIKLLKKKFPSYTIVQLGVNKERCPDMQGADINLVGKTTLEDVACLLKYSSLHIDAEGGFVHLRHAIHGGKSVVLFGPTDLEYYQYPENINIKTNVCGVCEWCCEGWLDKCVRGLHNPSCMYSITPELVIEQIEKAGALYEKL